MALEHKSEEVADIEEPNPDSSSRDASHHSPAGKTAKPKISRDELIPYGINDETPYGWLNFRPNAIQCCNRIGWFTFLMMA